MFFHSVTVVNATSDSVRLTTTHNAKTSMNARFGMEAVPTFASTIEAVSSVNVLQDILQETRSKCS